jgi:hypothetical protein
MSRFLLPLAVCVVALIMRIAVASQFGQTDPRNLGSAEPQIIAANLAAGHGYVYDFYGLRPGQPLRAYLPPLHPILLAGLIRLSPTPAHTMNQIQIVLSSVTCVLIYSLSATLSGDRKVGIVSGGLAALHPVFTIQALNAIPLTLLLFLLSAALLAAARLQLGGGLCYAAATGVGIGLLALIHPHLLGLALLIALGLWITGVSRRTVLLASGVIALCALAPIVPWTARNYRIFHRVVLISTNGGYNFWIGNNPFSTGSGWDVDIARYLAYAGKVPTVKPATVRDGIGQVIPYPLPKELEPVIGTIDELELERRFYQAGFNFICSSPRRWLALLRDKALYYWWFRPNIGSFSPNTPSQWVALYKVQYLGLLALSLVGAAAMIRQWRRYFVMYALPVYMTLIYIVFFVLTRYRWEIEPVLLIFAGAGLVTLADLISRAVGTRRLSRPGSVD